MNRPAAGPGLPGRLFLAALCLAALLFCGAPGRAWGPLGHRAVAHIAEAHLSPEARAEVRAILGRESLADASMWPDEVRRTPEWKHSAPWHFVDFADHETYATAAKNPDGDVVVALTTMRKILADRHRSREERRVALRFIAHFVGDVHQPLHVGRVEDRGGNDIEVLWFGEPTNLHRVWDQGLLGPSRLSSRELARLLLLWPSRKNVATWQRDDLATWVAESHALRPRVYRLGGGIGKPRLGWAYMVRLQPVAEHRLLQAGIRLAGWLNQSLPAR